MAESRDTTTRPRPGIEYIENIIKGLEGRRSKNARRKATLQQDADAAEDEDMAEAAAPTQDEAQGLLGPQMEDPEPPVFDESVWQAVVLPALELDSLDLDSLSIGTDQAADAYLVLLEQGGVVECNEGTGDTLQLLFDTVVRGTGAMPGQACHQLLRHYATLAPMERPEWAPSLTDFYDALVQLGYRGDGSAFDSGAAGPGRSLKRGRPSFGGVPLSPAPAPAPAGATGAASSGVCLHNMRQVLILLTRLCELHQSRGSKGLLDFGPQAQVGGQRLLWGLLQLQLSSPLCRVAWAEVVDALRALADAWADDASWDQVVGQVRGHCTALEADSEVSARAPKIGPSFRACIVLIHNLPSGSQRCTRLQQAMAAALVTHLDPRGPSAAAATRAPGCPACAALSQLSAMAGAKPEGLLRAVRDTPASGVGTSRAGAGGVGDGSRPDYWRITTLVEAVHVVVWGQVYGGGAGADAQVGRMWHDWCRGLCGGLRSSNSAAATQLRVLLSEVVNLMDFGVVGG